jgi:hypothetical protein
MLAIVCHYGWLGEVWGVEKRISPLAAHDEAVSSFGRNDGPWGVGEDDRQRQRQRQRLYDP